MGLSASQARFLQLTARKSNVEYQAQQINQQRLQWSTKLQQASEEYQEKTSNRKMVFRYNNGTEIANIDVTYNNYKSYMNQQKEGIFTSQNQYFLVSSSGNKIVVSSEEEREEMIRQNGERFSESDFMIAEGLNDTDNFQKALEEGVYFFATYEQNDDGETYSFKTQSWDTLGNGAIREEYDKSDDAAAEAKYQLEESRIQNIDKKLELQLNQLETERDAIQTEMDSVQKVVDDNIESTFQVFS